MVFKEEITQKDTIQPAAKGDEKFLRARVRVALLSVLVGRSAREILTRKSNGLSFISLSRGVMLEKFLAGA